MPSWVESNADASTDAGGRSSQRIRQVFLEACRAGRTVLAAPEVAAGWDEASALEHLTVGALAGHLMRAVTSVDAYLRVEVPDEAEIVDAPGYFLSIDGLAGDDLDSELHRAIRRRAEEESGLGHSGVLDRWDTALHRLAAEFEEIGPDRRVAALGGRALLLDQYLVTRLVELLVHTDDLAASVGIDRPAFAAEAETAVIDCLVEIARRRHGPAAVITALTRRERDTIHALRVL